VRCRGRAYIRLARRAARFDVLLVRGRCGSRRRSGRRFFGKLLIGRAARFELRLGCSADPGRVGNGRRNSNRSRAERHLICAQARERADRVGPARTHGGACSVSVSVERDF
jgi:hypothetical protein